MTDTIQYAGLIIYLFALVSLFTYGMNCYFLMIFYRLKRPQALKQHARNQRKIFPQLFSKRLARGYNPTAYI